MPALLLLTCLVVAGRLSADPATAVLRTLETPEFKQLRVEGFQALYNMDYPAARAKFELMRQKIPAHPAGHVYAAASIWVELLNSRRRLQISLYSSEFFYSETEDRVSPEVDRLFRGTVAEALKRADDAARRNPRDAEAVYYQGAAHGLLASYEATVARKFISSLRNGSKAVDLHKRVVQIDPSFVDAYVTIGTYDYVVGGLPFLVKILAAIGGFRGSKSRGLAELERVTVEGLYATDDARVVLLAFYAREKRYADILRILETLAKRYPRNYLFGLERAGILARLGRRDESYAAFERLLKDRSAAPVLDLVHFQYGEALAAEGRHSAAIDHFTAAATAGGAGPEIVARAHLRAAQMLDLEGRRQEAVLEYQEVLRRENVFDSHDRAREGLKKPFRGGA